MGGSGVLSVDETWAGEAQLRAAASKGLQTAQAMHADVMGAARQALLGRPAEVAAHVRALRALLPLPPAVAAAGRLADVHAREPFDDATLAVLDAAEPEALRWLAGRLALGGGGGKKRKSGA